MSDQDQSAEKTEQPTAKKLLDARKKGDIPKSNELTTSGALLAFILALALLFQGDAPEILQVMGNFLAQPEAYFSEKSASASSATAQGLLSIGSLFFLPGLAAILVLFAQHAIKFSGEKVMPKLSRISPATGIKNKLGSAGLFEFLKSGAKLAIFSTLMVAFMAIHLEGTLTDSLVSPHIFIANAARRIFEFLIYVLIVLVAIGAIDFLWQSANHIRKNMMTRKEVEDDHKESEGDPRLKGQRRQRAYDIAMNQMLADVPSADVIIVNPTHYAVALKWDPESGRPPVCLAKGVDEIAARIREKARKADVPIYRQPALARLIHATIEVGEHIHPNSYRAVAAAIRFAQRMREK